MRPVDHKMVGFLRSLREQAVASGDVEVATFSRIEMIRLFQGMFQGGDDISEVFDLLHYNKLMDADSKVNGNFEGHYITDLGVEFLRHPERFSVVDGEVRRVSTIEVDTTDWTGLSKAVSPQNLSIIREKTTELQLAIMQSDADIQLKTDACKRVEAVLILLEAPNVPWREVVALLSHPAVNAFFAATSLIQFIIGLAA
jgi:hypothetical protein